LKQEQVEKLLQEQKDSYMFFGEALVSIQVITEEEVSGQLKEFEKAKQGI